MNEVLAFASTPPQRSSQVLASLSPHPSSIRPRPLKTSSTTTMHPTRLLLARTPLIKFLGKRVPPSTSPPSPLPAPQSHPTNSNTPQKQSPRPPQPTNQLPTPPPLPTPCRIASWPTAAKHSSTARSAATTALHLPNRLHQPHHRLLPLQSTLHMPTVA